MITLLFVCTGNSCRSIMAEAIANHHFHHLFRAYSAGSHPTGEVHPMAIDTLAKRGIIDHDLDSKSLEDVDHTNPDIVITLCDNAKNEPCPIWAQEAEKLHWGITDPAKFSGDIREALGQFDYVFDTLYHHIQSLAESYKQQHVANDC